MIKKPTLFQSFIPIIFLIIFLVLNVRYFDDTLEGMPIGAQEIVEAPDGATLAYVEHDGAAIESGERDVFF